MASMDQRRLIGWLRRWLVALLRRLLAWLEPSDEASPTEASARRRTWTEAAAAPRRVAAPSGTEVLAADAPPAHWLAQVRRHRDARFVEAHAPGHELETRTSAAEAELPAPAHWRRQVEQARARARRRHAPGWRGWVGRAWGRPAGWVGWGARALVQSATGCAGWMAPAWAWVVRRMVAVWRFAAGGESTAAERVADARARPGRAAPGPGELEVHVPEAMPIREPADHDSVIDAVRTSSDAVFEAPLPGNPDVAMASTHIADAYAPKASVHAPHALGARAPSPANHRDTRTPSADDGDAEFAGPTLRRSAEAACGTDDRPGSDHARGSDDARGLVDAREPSEVRRSDDVRGRGRPQPQVRARRPRSRAGAPIVAADPHGGMVGRVLARLAEAFARTWVRGRPRLLGVAPMTSRSADPAMADRMRPTDAVERDALTPSIEPGQVDDVPFADDLRPGRVPNQPPIPTMVGPQIDALGHDERARTPAVPGAGGDARAPRNSARVSALSTRIAQALTRVGCSLGARAPAPVPGAVGASPAKDQDREMPAGDGFDVEPVDPAMLRKPVEVRKSDDVRRSNEVRESDDVRGRGLRRIQVRTRRPRFREEAPIVAVDPHRGVVGRVAARIAQAFVRVVSLPGSVGVLARTWERGRPRPLAVVTMSSMSADSAMETDISPADVAEPHAIAVDPHAVAADPHAVALPTAARVVDQPQGSEAVNHPAIPLIPTMMGEADDTFGHDERARTPAVPRAGGGARAPRQGTDIPASLPQLLRGFIQAAPAAEARAPAAEARAPAPAPGSAGAAPAASRDARMPPVSGSTVVIAAAAPRRQSPVEPGRFTTIPLAGLTPIAHAWPAPLATDSTASGTPWDAAAPSTTGSTSRPSASGTPLAATEPTATASIRRPSAPLVGLPLLITAACWPDLPEAPPAMDVSDEESFDDTAHLMRWQQGQPSPPGSSWNG